MYMIFHVYLRIKGRCKLGERVLRNICKITGQILITFIQLAWGLNNKDVHCMSCLGVRMMKNSRMKTQNSQLILIKMKLKIVIKLRMMKDIIIIMKQMNRMRKRKMKKKKSIKMKVKIKKEKDKLTYKRSVKN